MMNDDVLSSEVGGGVGLNEFPSSSELISSTLNNSSTTTPTTTNNNTSATSNTTISHNNSNSNTIIGGGGVEEMNGKSDDEMMEENSDDREGCRSLICDSNGIIVAEMVYRCMICANVVESIAEAQKHYRIKHIGEELIEPSPNSGNGFIGYNNNHLTSSAKFNTNNNNGNGYHSNSGNLVNHSFHNNNSNSNSNYNHGFNNNNSSNTSSGGFSVIATSTPLKSSSLTSSPNKDSGSKGSNSLALMMNGDDGNQSDEAEDYSFTSQEMPFLFNHHNNNNNYDYVPSFISNFDDFDPTQFLSQTFTTEPTSKKSKTESTNGTSSSRGGYVTCAVCNITKFYASVQRRYGQFTCMGCAKFFGRFLMKPRRYYCPNLGTCPLAQSPRCKACLLQACIRTYVIDDKRMKIVNANRPLKRMGPNGGSLPSESLESPPPPPVTPTPTTGTVTLRNTKETNKKESSLLASSNEEKATSGRSKANNKEDKLNSPSTVTKKGAKNVSSRDSPAKNATESTVTGSSPNKTPTSTPKKSNTTNGTNSGRKTGGCRSCSGCLAEDCGNCHYCLDKPKFGGGNTLKKKCIAKRCLMQGYKIKPSDNLKKIKITRK